MTPHEPTVIDIIVADNDPRNGGLKQRLLRMFEQPDRRPDADGLYPDAPDPESCPGPCEWCDDARATR